jgi:hypothetical protein
MIELPTATTPNHKWTYDAPRYVLVPIDDPTVERVSVIKLPLGVWIRSSVMPLQLASSAIQHLDNLVQRLQNDKA